MKSPIRRWFALGLIGGFCLSAAATLEAQLTVYLRADTVIQTMPDGRQVLMWGYAKDSSFGAHDGTVTVPGPLIAVPQTFTKLTIVLENNLPEATSIIIPNQHTASVLDNGTPVPPTTHTRFTDAQSRSRATSFTFDTPPGNTTPVSYVWENLTPGTYLYHSGSHAALQTQMGLYGAMIKRMPSGTTGNGVYPGVVVKLGNQIPLVFSEIDAEVHDAVQAGQYGPGGTITSMQHSVPDYFLINGQCYTDGQPVIQAGALGDTILLRMINASANQHVPVLGQRNMTVIAEDGRPYADQKTDQYSVFLPAMKTCDVLFVPLVGGAYPIYDRATGFTSHGTTGPAGGMLTYLAIRQTFTTTAPANIPESGQASRYGFNLTVPATFDWKVANVRVTLNKLSHPRPADLDILLVSPNGTAVMLMSDAGGTAQPANLVTLTFDDSLSASVPTPLGTGAWKPTDINAGPDTFPAPAPAGPYATTLSAFNGTPAAGTWSLYIVDDDPTGGGTGRLNAGWQLSLSPAP